MYKNIIVIYYYKPHQMGMYKFSLGRDFRFLTSLILCNLSQQ